MVFLGLPISSKHFKKYLLTLLPLTLTQIAALISFLFPMIMVAQTGGPHSIAVIGLFNFLIFITYIPVSNTIIDVAGIYFATFYGAKKYSKLIDYVYKTLFTFLLEFIFSWIIFYFASDIFIFIQIDPIIAVPAGKLLRYSMLYLPIYSLSGFLQGYLSSQHVHKFFDLISAISMASTITFCYYFIVHLKMVEYGYIPARFCQELIVFILYLILTFFYAKSECVGWPDFKILFVEYFTFLKRITISVISVLAEFLAFEFNTYLAALLHNVNEFAIWEAWAFSHGVSFFLSLAISSTIRRDIGHLMGAGNMKQAKEETIGYFIYTLVLSVVIGIIYWNLSHKMASLFFTDPYLIHRLANCLKIYITFIFFYMVFYPIFMVFRLLRLDNYFLIIIAIGFPIVIVVVNTAIFLYLGLGVIGLVIGHVISTTFICALCLRKVFLVHDWEHSEHVDINPEDEEEFTLREE